MKSPRRAARTLALILLLGGALLATSAPAGDWQYLSGDASESTLECFGDFEDPVCAAETYLACATWFPIIAKGREYYGYDAPIHDLGTCDGTWPGNEGSYPVGLNTRGWTRDQTARLLFRVAEPWVLEQEDMVSFRWPWEPSYFTPRAGDTIVDFESIGCYPGPQCTAPGEPERLDCPITYCADQDHVGVETFRSEPSGTYEFPMGFVIMRHERGAWRLVHIHKWYSFNYRDGEDSWRPQHYRIGPVEE